MNEVQQVRNGGPEPLDFQCIDTLDAGNDFFSRITAVAVMEQAGERLLTGMPRRLTPEDK